MQGRPVIVDRFDFVFFDSGSARITPQAAARLDRVLTWYDAAPASCQMLVAAHADREGPASANLALSRRRAEAVAAYLRSRRPAAPVTAEYFGETRPLVDTADGVAEPQNRRAEVHVGEVPVPAAAAAPSPALAAAEAFVDAFYSFDPARLRQSLAAAPAAVPVLVFYQGWAQGGNYVALDRKPCRASGPDQVSCDITVRDDLIAALGSGFNVTDTFHLTMERGRIVGARISSNDPPEFQQALDWLRAERPELMTGPCQGFFNGGPTPGDCVRAIVRGFADFRARRGTQRP